MRRWLWAILIGGGLTACQAPRAPTGQADPGAEGNGVEAQPGPYLVPPEASGLLGDAPAGFVSPPSLYESSVYPGWRFQYWLYVPAQYVSDSPAALMVFQDGGVNYIDFLRTPTVLDNLIDAGDIPVTIGLFINPGTPTGLYSWEEGDHEARSEQYDSMDDRYARFLLDGIIPDVVLADYNVVEDPDGWAVVGYSSGGIAAFTVGWHRPDRFHKVLTHNGSFVDLRGGGIYPALIRATEPKPLRIYLLSGTNDLVLAAGRWFEANNAMAAALEDRSYAFRYRSGSGAHNPPDQALADFPDALRWLWRGYSLPR